MIGWRLGQVGVTMSGMTSRQVRFVLAGIALVAATLLGQYAGGSAASNDGFWAVVDVGLVILAARGHRLALRFLIANAGLFGMLMLLFGSDARFEVDGACFVTAAYLLFTLRHETRGHETRGHETRGHETRGHETARLAG